MANTPISSDGASKAREAFLSPLKGTTEPSVPKTTGFSNVDSTSVSDPAKKPAADIPKEPAKPILTPPKNDFTPQELQNSSDSIHANPWMKGTATTDIFMMFQLLIEMLARTSYLEKTNTIEGMTSGFEVRQKAAETGKEAAKSQASEQMGAMFASIGKGTLAIVDVAKSVSAPAKAEEMFTNKLQEKNTEIDTMKSTQTRLATANFDNQAIPNTFLNDKFHGQTYADAKQHLNAIINPPSPSQQITVGNVLQPQQPSPGDIQQAKNDLAALDKNQIEAYAATPDGQAALEGAKATLSDLSKLEGQRDAFEKRKLSTIDNYTNQINQQSQGLSSIFTHIIDAGNSLFAYAERSVQADKGEYQKNLEALADLLSKVENINRTAASDASQTISSLLRDFDQFSQSLARLNVMGRA